MNNEPLKPEQGTPIHDGPDREVEGMIEKVWQHLQGRVNRSDILQVILKILPKYENARVTIYVPILVHREAVDVLRTRLDEPKPYRPVRDAKPDSHPVKRDDLVTGIALPTGS